MNIFFFTGSSSAIQDVSSKVRFTLGSDEEIVPQCGGQCGAECGEYEIDDVEEVKCLKHLDKLCVVLENTFREVDNIGMYSSYFFSTFMAQT